MLSCNNNTPYIDPRDYFLDSEIIAERKGGRGDNCTIYKDTTGTEWVKLEGNVKLRFCGFLYLKKALEESNLDYIKAAENKIAIHDRKIVYLSKYCGEEKVSFFKYIEKLQPLQTLGFTDIAANLRILDEKIYVFDTELKSFNQNVYEKILTYKPTHKSIRAFVDSQ